MAEAKVCTLCNSRRVKRACPAVHHHICTICCGEQREVTLACPLDCVFLREARKHEEPVEIPADEISNPDVEVSEEFIRSSEKLLLFSMYALLQASLRTIGAVDTDVLDALEALIRTHLTSQTGLVYETRAANTVAAAIQQKMASSLSDYEKERQEREDTSRHPDQDVFKILVFLHRIGQQNLNGRAKGRMFLDMLRSMTPEIGVDERAPSIIL